jgi:hypothetical protein
MHKRVLSIVLINPIINYIKIGPAIRIVRLSKSEQPIAYAIYDSLASIGTLIA